MITFIIQYIQLNMKVTLIVDGFFFLLFAIFMKLSSSDTLETSNFDYINAINFISIIFF